MGQNETGGESIQDLEDGTGGAVRSPEAAEIAAELSNEPVHDDPVHEESVYEESVHEESVHEESVHEEPVQEALVHVPSPPLTGREKSAVPDTARGWLQNAKTIAIAVALAFGVRIGIAQAYEIDGPSMEPTVFQHERVLVARCAYGLSIPFVDDAILRWSEPVPGDVVIVQSPRDPLDLVKRVIGVAGDTIELRNGVIYRNGVAITQRELGECDPTRQLIPEAQCRVYEESLGERRWRISRSLLDLESITMSPVTVPEGHVFVVGDHRDRSNDSRFFGPVPVSRVRGRVMMVD